jgi:hypothetical protein
MVSLLLKQPPFHLYDIRYDNHYSCYSQLAWPTAKACTGLKYPLIKLCV